MKNYIVMAFLALGLCSTAFAQDNKASDKKAMKSEKKAHMSDKKMDGAEKKMDKKAAHESKKDMKAPK
jgi:hypothetical protein